MLTQLLLLSVCFFLAQTTIVITSPVQTGFLNNQIDYAYLNFGQIPYGKTLAFDVFITDKSLCSSDDLQHFTKPTYVVALDSILNACSFTKRALIAQTNGAKGLIIASQHYDYIQGKVFQRDDGNGKRVHITTLMISTGDYQKLRILKNVEIIANYPIPKETQSTLSIFISSAERSSYVFLREFREHYKYLKNYAKIEPIYHSIECKSCNQQNCLFETYCSYDYQNSKYDVGRKILMEQLHQLQIFSQKGADKWLQYMNLFDQYCITNWYVIEQCVKKILRQMNMTDVELRRNPIETLNSWKSKEHTLGFDSFPEVAINNMIYRGNFDTDQILLALCESLYTPPQYCIDGASPTDDEKGNDHLAIILVVTCVSIVVVSAIGVCVYRKFIKRELTNDMTSRVGELVANYANKVSKQKIRQKQKFIEANDEEL